MTTTRPSPSAAPGSGSSDWYDRPMRWLQLNLVADDTLHTDVAAWKQYWSESSVEALTISAAGATAQYPTDVPMHPRAEFLGERDLFGELVAAAKDLDIRVLARFEPNMVSAQLAAAHPDWITQRAGHRPFDIPWMDAKAAADFAKTFAGGRPRPCFNGPYYREFMPQVMSELAARYPIDGFYANGWPPIGAGPPSPHDACSCPSCLTGWRSRGHEAYPTGVDPRDPVWNDFVQYIQECYESVQRLWQEHIKAIRPDLSFVCNLHGSLANAIRWDQFGPLVDLFANDSQGRHTAEPRTPGVAAEALWTAARSAAIIDSLAEGKPTCHIVGAWHAGAPPLRRVAKEPLEIRTMLAQVVARGARPWCNVAGGTIYDRRWMDEVRDYYQWHAGVTEYLRNTRSNADVAILWTPEAIWPVSSDPELATHGPSLALAFHGWQETLLRERQPFDVLPIQRVSEASLAPYRALIVPSGSVVDERGAQTIARFADDGGGLIVGCGVLAPTFGDGGGEGSLAAVLGVARPDPPAGPHFSAYVDLVTGTTSTLLDKLGDTDYLPAGRWIATAPVVDGAVGAGRLQPPLPFLADLAYVSRAPDDAPVFVEYGRCVYLGTDLDALHGSSLLPDCRAVLRNSLRTATAGRPPKVALHGPGVIAVHAWEQATSETIHLVNLTNPNLYGGPLDEIYPVGPLALELETVAGSVKSVQLLRAGAAAQWRTTPGGRVVIDVPEIADFEVVAIDRT